MRVTKAKMSHFGHSYTKCPILAGPICYARDILSKKDREVKTLACTTVKLFANSYYLCQFSPQFNQIHQIQRMFTFY